MFELGIYGGTFAPVHNGHIYAAHSFLESCKLDRLLIMPTRIPPHKQISPDDEPQIRLEMLKLAFPETENSILTVCDYELHAPPPSYTAKTLEHFTAPDTRITFFCGTDMFLSLESWYHPEIIFRLARIAHIRRYQLSQTEEAEIARLTAYFTETYGADILHLPALPYPMSSTEIRKRVRNGESISGEVPDAVRAFIHMHRLYTEEPV